MITVRELAPDELAWANARYAEADFVASSRSDFIAVAAVDGVRAGLGRLVPIDNGVAELGGMYVLPEFRGRSVAANIVQFLLQRSAYPRLFCIPFANLEPFYGSFGFVPVPEGITVPGVVNEKFAWCRSHYNEPVRLLVRDGSPTTKRSST